jgi:DNA polymerase-3 subunit beta
MDSVTRVDVTLSKQQIELNVGKTRLLSRLIDGKFPDYKQIIPKDTKTNVLFPTKELSLVTKRMHYFAKEVNNNLTFRVGSAQTRIATPQTQIGKDEAIIDAEAKGDENKIALSSSYLLDFLGHISSDVVEMRLTDNMHPAVFKLPDMPNYLHLIMPLRMQEE